MTDPPFPFKTREEEEADFDRMMKRSPLMVRLVLEHVLKRLYDLHYEDPYSGQDSFNVTMDSLYHTIERCRELDHVSPPAQSPYNAWEHEWRATNKLGKDDPI